MTRYNLNIHTIWLHQLMQIFEIVLRQKITAPRNLRNRVRGAKWL